MRTLVSAPRFVYGLFFACSLVNSQQSADTETKPALGEQVADLNLTDTKNTSKNLSTILRERPTVLLMLATPADQADCRDQGILFEQASGQLNHLGMDVIPISRGSLAERQRICGSHSQFRFSADAGQLRSTAALLVDQDRTVRRVFPLDGLRAEAIVDEAGLWVDGMATYKAQCARCHGDDGRDTSYPGTKSLSGIGNRHTEKEIFELTQRAGFVDLSSLDDRGRRALSVFVAGL